MALSQNNFQTAETNIAIVYLSRTDIRPLTRDVLIDKGIDSIKSPGTLEECKIELEQHPDALLICDWEQGQLEVVSLLKNEQKQFSAVSRPIYLMCRQADPKVIATAHEYSVTTVHSGEISKAAIGRHLDTILSSGGDFSSIRNELAHAKACREQAKWQDSKKVFQDLRIRFPNENRFTVEVASDLINMDHWDEAYPLLEEVVITDELNLRALHLFARCHMRSGDYDKALKLLSSAQTFNPFHPHRLVDLGKCLLQIDDIATARQAFDDALELDCELREAIILKGQCDLMDGHIKEGLDLISEISGPKELASIFNNAAILTIRHERFQAGVALYETAIASLGKGPKPRTQAKLIFNLGLGYLRWKKEDEALECFEKALHLDPQFRKAAHNAKVTAASLGRDAAIAPQNTAKKTDKRIAEDFETEI